jgi:hypothetical protein
MARSQRLHQRPNTFAQTTFAIVRFSLATLRRTIHTDNPIYQDSAAYNPSAPDFAIPSTHFACRPIIYSLLYKK